MKALLLMLSTISFFVSPTQAKEIDYLQLCWNKQLGNLGNKYLNVSYTESLNELYHSPEPWQQSHYNVTGRFWCSANNYRKVDSLVSRNKTLSSCLQMDSEKLLFRDYRSTGLSPVTKAMFSNQVFESARYTPQNLINYCLDHKILADKKSDKTFAIYTVTINTSIVKLFIRKADCLAAKVTTLSHDDLYGDVLSTFTYADYATTGTTFYPATITIDKYSGRVKDTVRAAKALLVEVLPKLLDALEGYAMQEPKEKIYQLHTEHYNENIHFIDISPTRLKGNGSRV